MDVGLLFGRGMSFPPRIGADGRIAWSEGEANVREAVRIILLTELGERLVAPQFGCGLALFLFEPNTVATRFSIAERITRALGQWEPRIAVDAVSVEADTASAESAVATIVFRLVATQSQERVSLNVTLGG